MDGWYGPAIDAILRGQMDLVNDDIRADLILSRAVPMPTYVTAYQPSYADLDAQERLSDLPANALFGNPAWVPDRGISGGVWYGSPPEVRPLEYTVAGNSQDPDRAVGFVLLDYSDEVGDPDPDPRLVYYANATTRVVVAQDYDNTKPIFVEPLEGQVASEPFQLGTATITPERVYNKGSTLITIDLPVPANGTMPAGATGEAVRVPGWPIFFEGGGVSIGWLGREHGGIARIPV